MEKQNEAVVVMAKCSETKKFFGIRTEKNGVNSWVYTWSFPLKESAAKREGYDKTSIQGRIIHGSEFQGCPICSNKNLIACSCGHLSCWNGSDTIFTCSWCGAHGTVTAYTGGKIVAGVDA